jgi:large subunit ribosomal protein L18
MGKREIKLVRAERRKSRIRRKVFGYSARPRLTVNKSLNNITAQIIDDEKMITVAAASSLSKGMVKKVAGKTKLETAGIVGEELAKVALEKGIKKVTFDRNRNIYHGRVKSLADAARKGGLEF